MRVECASLACAALAVLLAACGGSSGGSGSNGCGGDCQPAQNFLTESDVQRVIAQAVGEAQARNVRAQIAVVDRVGNVLAVFRMTGAPGTVAISSGLGVTGGLDFSTRTASQIVQEHFNPGESQQPSGPLYGVQFSQLSCSDVNRNASHGSVGPKRSPLGLAADPGGLPLYKNGVVVGGIGIEANGRYGIDRNITDTDSDDEEIVAVAGSAGFAAPADIRGDRITADGRTFRYVDSEAMLADPVRAPAFASLPGALVPRIGRARGLRRLRRRGRMDPRRRRQRQSLPAARCRRWPAPRERGAGDARRGDQRRAPRTRPDPPPARLVRGSLHRDRRRQRRHRGLRAHRRRARLRHRRRRTEGAHRALLLASRGGRGTRVGATGALSLPTGRRIDRPGGIAWSARAVGNVHRPTFPDGIEGTPAGALSTPVNAWSPFNVGFQLDLVYNQLVKGVLGDTSEGCAGRLPAGATPVAGDTGIAKLRNGAQIFPGAVPIYRGARLVGAIGVSGDGVDQDDMIASLGLANAARNLATGLGHAPAAMRTDTLTPMGVRLRYVQCPQAPFNGSDEQNACAGL